MGTAVIGIDGVRIVRLREIPDPRGAVLHVIRRHDPDVAELGECYLSELTPGAVKAWKRHRLQTQRIAVPIGRVQLVLYDDRPVSRTRLTLRTLELGRPDAYLRVTIPPAVWYGFGCLGLSPALIVNCPDLPHDIAEGETVATDDRRVPFDWTATRL